MMRTRAKIGAVALAGIVSAACFDAGEITFGPENDDLVQLGTILASTNTAGSAPDPDGYTVRLDEARSEPIGINGLVTFSSLKVGSYNVSLTDFAGNCVVTGSNPINIVLQADSVRQAHFDVVCN